MWPDIGDPGGFYGIIDHPISDRMPKPRMSGITMVIDKGIGPRETRDLLEVAGDAIDFIKFAFGSSVLYPSRVLRHKIDIIKSYDIHVYPGGTLMEIALYEDRIEPFLRRCKEMGFTYVEVSEGTLDITPPIRESLIKASLDSGLGVVSEVGKKDPLKRLSDARIQEQICRDLEIGVFKVIVEGRDSGKGVGIYDNEGNIKDEELNRIRKGISTIDHLIIEAPMPDQQKGLLKRFGSHVNLGNVQVHDVFALECMRAGLRSDTLSGIVSQKEETYCQLTS